MDAYPFYMNRPNDRLEIKRCARIGHEGSITVDHLGEGQENVD
jgi:hypothetical protein